MSSVPVSGAVVKIPPKPKPQYVTVLAPCLRHITIPALEYLLQRGRKVQMMAHLNSHPGDFEKAVALSVSNRQPAARRSAWLLSSVVLKNDARLLPLIDAMVNAPERVHHQRQLLKILLVTDLKEELQGTVYGTCLKLWLQIQNQPSLRHRTL